MREGGSRVISGCPACLCPVCPPRRAGKPFFLVAGRGKFAGSGFLKDV